MTTQAEPAIPQARIGHIVLNVTDVQLSARFYCHVLGMRQRRSGVFNGDRMVFLTFGERDHDMALVQVSPQALATESKGVGLGHVAFRIGDQMSDLRRFKQHLDRLGIVSEQMVEHLYARSIYFRDPDGIALDCETNTPFMDDEMQVDNPLLSLE